MLKFKARKRNARKGQSLVEYGLILALVSVVAIAALQLMGDRINTAVKSAGDQVQNASANAGETYCTNIGGTWSTDDGTCSMNAE